MNKAILMGRIVKEGELKYLNSGTAILNTTLATNRRVKDQNEATFHNLTIFGKQAEIFSQYVKKGHQVTIEGTIQNRSYEKDGVTHYASGILVDTFHFISQGSPEAGSGGDTKPSNAKVATKPKSIPDEDFGDIPF